MNNNNKQLPPLPDPHIGLPWRHNAPDGSIHSSAFTAEQMREYALQAIAYATQPAEVTDDQIESCALEAGFSVESTGSIWAVDGLVGTRVDPGLRKFAKAILALHPVQSTFCEYCGGNDEEPVDHCMDCTRPMQVQMTDAHPMQPIVVAENGRIRFKKNQIVNDLYELHKVHKLDLNEMARRNYSQEDRNQFAQLIGYSVDGWSTLSYAMDVEKAEAIADSIATQTKKGTP